MTSYCSIIITLSELTHMMRVEEGSRFSKKEKDPMTLKELNEDINVKTLRIDNRYFGERVH